tara:strand:- start:293 stop:1234 length:942 start_codon:yes stop_codon:yes gene_type:complete
MQCQTLNNNTNFTWFSCIKITEEITTIQNCNNIFEHDFFYILECKKNKTYEEKLLPVNITNQTNLNVNTYDNITIHRNNSVVQNTTTATVDANTVADAIIETNKTSSRNSSEYDNSSKNNNSSNSTAHGNRNIQYNRTNRKVAENSEGKGITREEAIVSIVAITILFCIAMCYFLLKVVCKNRKRKLRRRSSRTVAPEHIEIGVLNTPTKTIKKQKGKYLKIKQNAPTLTIEKQVLETIQFMIKHLELQELRKQKHKLLKKKMLPAKKVSMAKVAEILRHKNKIKHKLRITKAKQQLKPVKRGMLIKEIFDGV